jgi:ribosomal protein S12 methylthiotransferase accessory factor
MNIEIKEELRPECALKAYLKFKGTVVDKLYSCFNFTDEPKFHQWSCSYFTKNLNLYPEDIKNNLGSGLSLDADTAKLKSLGECIERYCLADIKRHKLIKGTPQTVDSVVNLDDFVNFSEDITGDRQKYLEKIKMAKFKWVQGSTLLPKDASCNIPAQLVFVPYYENEPILRSIISTGAAAGTSFAGALYRGTLEIMERDAYSIFWQWLLPAKKININSTNDDDINKLSELFERYYLEPHVLSLPTDMNCHVMLTFLLDRSGAGPAVVAGVKAELDPKKAIIGSLQEVQSTRIALRYKCDALNLKPIKDPKNIITLEERALYWTDLEKIKLIEPTLKRSECIKYDKLKPTCEGDLKDKLGYIFNAFKNKNYSLYYINLSKKQEEKQQIHVVKVLSPNLHPMNVIEKFKSEYGKRLYEFPKSLGVTRLTPNQLPSPFA